MLVCCVIIATVALLLSFSLWFKFRLLAISILTSRALPSANALIPTHLSYFTTLSTVVPASNNSETPPCSSLVEYEYLFILVGSLLAVFLVGCVFVVMWKRYDRMCCNWIFGLNIGNEKENVIIPIQTFPNHPYCYVVTAETFVESLELKGCLGNMLHIDWPTFEVTYWPNTTKIKLQ